MLNARLRACLHVCDVPLHDNGAQGASICKLLKPEVSTQFIQEMLLSHVHGVCSLPRAEGYVPSSQEPVDLCFKPGKVTPL